MAVYRQNASEFWSSQQDKCIVGIVKCLTLGPGQQKPLLTGSGMQLLCQQAGPQYVKHKCHVYHQEDVEKLIGDRYKAEHSLNIVNYCIWRLSHAGTFKDDSTQVPFSIATTRKPGQQLLPARFAEDTTLWRGQE